MLHLSEPPDIPPLKSQPYWKIHRLPNRSHYSQKRLVRPTAIVRASGKTPAAVWGQPDWLLRRMNSCMQIWMVAKGKTLSNQPDYSTNIINEASDITGVLHKSMPARLKLQSFFQWTFFNFIFMSNGLQLSLMLKLLSSVYHSDYHCTSRIRKYLKVLVYFQWTW